MRNAAADDAPPGAEWGALKTKTSCQDGASRAKLTPREQNNITHTITSSAIDVDQHNIPISNLHAERAARLLADLRSPARPTLHVQLESHDSIHLS